MSTYTQNGITFDDVKTTLMHFESIPAGTGTTGVDEFGGIINVTDIDWNAAKPGIGEGTDGITTTGQMLSLIKDIYESVNATQTKMDNLMSSLLYLSSYLSNA